MFWINLKFVTLRLLSQCILEQHPITCQIISICKYQIFNIYLWMWTCMTQTQNVCIYLYEKWVCNSVYAWNVILSSPMGLIWCLHHLCARTCRGVCGTTTSDVFICVKSRGSSGCCMGQAMILTCGHGMFS